MKLSELREMIDGNVDKFYVYVMYRPDTGFPFYVGKGRGRRVFMHEMDMSAKRIVNDHKHNIIYMLNRTGLSVDYEIAAFFDDEDVAFKYEKVLIEILGREVNGGILVNLIEGGTGLNGLTDESVQKRVSSWRTAYNSNPDWQAHMHQRGKQLAANPTFQARRLAAQKDMLRGEKNITHLRKLAVDPECRAKVVAGVKAFHADPVKSAEFSEKCRVRLSTPEKRKEFGDRMRAHFADPANKAAHVEKRKAYFAEDPSRIAKTIAAMQEACRTPEAVNAQKESRARTWALQTATVARCEELIRNNCCLNGEKMPDKRSGLPKWLDFEKYLLAKTV